MIARTLLLPACFLMALWLSVGSVSAQQDEATQPAETPATRPVAQPSADEMQAEQAMQELLGTRKAAPVIEPQAAPAYESQADAAVEYPGFRGRALAAPGDIDPAILGVAPGEDPPPLRREGEFVVNRRGRLIRSSDGGYLLFVFESDTQRAPELPMVIQACQLLETMEEIVEKRGDSTVFILTGQVNTYHGANYLLPTMMKIAFDKGNLTN